MSNTTNTAAEVTEPTPTATPTKATTAKPKRGKMPVCPRNHREDAAKARCRAYWERTGHLNPRHLPKTKEA